jgi:hypothetical protein
MWNRGRRSVGLGLTNREIAELRCQGLYQVLDLNKFLFFLFLRRYSELARELSGDGYKTLSFTAV